MARKWWEDPDYYRLLLSGRVVDDRERLRQLIWVLTTQEIMRALFPVVVIFPMSGERF